MRERKKERERERERERKKERKKERTRDLILNDGDSHFVLYIRDYISGRIFWGNL